MRDPSHMRNLSKEEFTAMFREELLTVTKVDIAENGLEFNIDK